MLSGQRQLHDGPCACAVSTCAQIAAVYATHARISASRRSNPQRLAAQEGLHANGDWESDTCSPSAVFDETIAPSSVFAGTPACSCCEGTMGKYAREPANATKSCKVRLLHRSSQLRVVAASSRRLTRPAAD